MKTINQSILLLKKNIRSIIGFEITYRLICVALLLPLLTGAFHLSLWLAGYRYLSPNRIMSYMMTPTTILILCFILLSISIITVFEVFCLIPAFDASYHGISISLTSMFQQGLYALKKSSEGKNKYLFLYTLILVPITNITILSGYFSSIMIPDFILYYIRSNKFVFRFFCIVLILAFINAIRSCLSLHCYCLEPGDFAQAKQHSKAMIRKHYFKTILYLLFWNLAVMIVLLLLALLSFGIGVIVLRLFFYSDYNSANIFSIFNSILTVLFDLYIFCSVPITCSYLSALYYKQKLRLGEEIRPCKLKRTSIMNRIGKRFILSLILLAALFNVTYLGLFDAGNLFWNQNIISEPIITAHRGDSKLAPENTLPAFQSAIDNKADCIELDVQQTRDHEVVVLHDTNLKRLTGKNINVWNLTYDQLRQIDLGSHFSKDFSDVRVCTLEEVLAYCKGKIKLNIELKTTSHDADLEKKVISLIEEYDYVDDCVIAATNLTSLKEVKEQNENIKTIYLLPVAYGNYTEMTYVDGFSIKASFITRKLVNHIHDSGKVIYAWTVNKDEDMERMYSLGVDCLVTDYPTKAREVYYEQNLNPAIAGWLKQITKLYN